MRLKHGILTIPIVLLCLSIHAEAGVKTSPFTFKTLDNEIVHIDSLLQKGPVLFTFWALWCKPCKEEMHAINRVRDQHPFDKITVVSVNLDTPRSMARVKSYVSTLDFPFVFCKDPSQDLLRRFTGVGIPYTVFITENREIELKHSGYVPGDEKTLQKEISRYVDKEEK